jgi:hypothetical protein
VGGTKSGAGSDGNVLLATTRGFVGIGTAAPATVLDVNGAQSMRAVSAPALSPSGQGRIYFDSGVSKFKVSENGGSYVDLLGSSTGTVSNVGLSLPAELTLTGGPITSSGTISGSWASQSAATVFAAPSGSAGAPSFRALASTDLPNIDTAKISTGTLSIARGGTNSGTALNNNRLMVSSGGAIVEAGSMTNGQIVIGSTGAAPVIGSLGSSNGISISTGAGTITISTNATSTNTVSTIVSRDTAGDFAAHDVTVNNVVAAGTVRATKQISAGSYSGASDSINWDNGNVQTTSSTCQALAFTNMQDGGSYTLVVTDSATAGCVFPSTINSGTAVSWKGQPTLTSHTRTASSHTVYTMLRVGAIIYVSWITGF